MTVATPGLMTLANDSSIPPQLGSLENLKHLYIGGNQLTGSIPTELGALGSLSQLVLDGNRLTGEIPAELGDLASLEGLWLWDNRLTGAIPTQLGSLPKLRQLALSWNRLSGSIPAELGDLTGLEWLYLGNNRLSGSIPASLGGLSKLEEIRLENNDLSGPVPWQLGNLENLEMLLLQENRLTGCLPEVLRDVATNDLESLNLPYCAVPSSEEPLVATATSAATIDLSWNEAASTTQYRVEYRVSGAEDWTIDDDTLTGTTHSVDDLACGTSYEFQVSGRGDDDTDWSQLWSATETTDDCLPVGIPTPDGSGPPQEHGDELGWCHRSNEVPGEAPGVWHGGVERVGRCGGHLMGHFGVGARQDLRVPGAVLRERHNPLGRLGEMVGVPTGDHRRGPKPRQPDGG